MCVGQALVGDVLFRGALAADFLSAARSNSGSFRPPGSRTLHTPPEQDVPDQGSPRHPMNRFDYSIQRVNQPITSSCHWIEFRGLSTQWFSSG